MHRISALKIKLLTVLAGCFFCACQPDDPVISSPDQKIRVEVTVNSGIPHYRIFRDDTVVLQPSELGITLQDENFTGDLTLTGTSVAEEVNDDFSMFHGKRKECLYKANRKVYHFENSNKSKMDVIFQVSDDGVAFRYSFPEKSKEVKTVLSENTSFHFPAGSSAFLQPMSEPKTGWSKVNPCYEEFYQQEIPAGTPSPTKSGWVYPALFHSGPNWILITEAGVNHTHCATRLRQNSPDGEYRVGFPDSLENFPGDGVNPQSAFPWKSPWRVLAIGSLKTIIESDLGVALADKESGVNTDFIKPGHASWSWAILKDDSTVFDVQKKMVDYAAAMKWDYCLVDADWDKKIGYARIKELTDYARTKNIGLILWYNSAGDWNETPYTPKSKLITRELRMKEFSLLRDMGIKGVKIDFFGGDGRSMIAYYLDILEDAAKHNLLVNFHGSTIPRGWHRTYPNLMSMEGVRGFEYVTFEQHNADQQPSHCAMLPFTRNAFDPMDFTPLSLDSVPRIRRKTTAGFELALSVLFLSGIQHFVEIPRGMKKVPEEVREFLQTLPAQWDDSKFIGGYPGKEVIIARKSHNKWFIAGINGEDRPKSLQLNLDFFKSKKVSLFTDGDRKGLIKRDLAELASLSEIKVKPNGGFVIVAE